MTREYQNYHDVNERLAGWRREILTRMRRLDELPLLPTITRVNLAAEPGADIRVDSYLGTTNTDRIQDAYFSIPRLLAQNAEFGVINFTVENPAHPTLELLRQRFPIQAVAGTGPDLLRAIRLRDWIKSLFPHFMPYRMPEWNALTILDRGERGIESFLCIHYTVALVQTCLALGLQARIINLHRGIADHYVIGEESSHDPPIDEHVVAEVWSKEHDRWVMLDTDYDCHFERDSIPQSAWDIHRAVVNKSLSSLQCIRGPASQAFTAYAQPIAADEEFFSCVLPSYYAHVSILMRNNFLSDPDGPVPVVHLTDEDTDPILWHGGSDLRLQPNLMGPVVVATPYTDKVTLLSDGNLSTSWSSSDAREAHWVECRFEARQRVGEIALHWPEHEMTYHTSRRISIDGMVDGQWKRLQSVVINPEGPFTKHAIHTLATTGIRIVQGAGDGHPSHPDRLWLSQVEIFAAPR